MAKLDSVVRELKTLGTVQTAETTSEDVTAQRVDLDARIKALQTSVDRLLAIMRDARDPEALIQPRTHSRSAKRIWTACGRSAKHSVTKSTTALSMSPSSPKRSAGRHRKEYQGFPGQVERGWDNMVFVVGKLVLLFGLLLPWLIVLAVAVVIVYGVIRLAGAGRSKNAAVNKPAAESDAAVAAQPGPHNPPPVDQQHNGNE